MAQNTQKDSPGNFGGFELLEKIVDSGMGSVYKGRNRATGQVVAVKVMPPFKADQGAAFQRFARECRIISSLNDPHIVHALDFGIEGSTPYLVMEYVEGETMGRRLARAGPLPEDEAVRLIAQVAGALGRVHSRGLVHRNVKPDNILIAANGQALLIDLGLVKIETERGVTVAGSSLGTPNFMPPEQFFNSGQASARCDVYSLAASLFMAVTGELPFGDCKVATMLGRKLQNDLQAPKKLVPTLSERTDKSIRRALSAEPNHRPATCAEFIEDLTGTGEIKLALVTQKAAEEQPVSEAAPSLTAPQVTIARDENSSGAENSGQYNSGQGGNWIMWIACALFAVAGFLVGLFLVTRG